MNIQNTLLLVTNSHSLAAISHTSSAFSVLQNSLNSSYPTAGALIPEVSAEVSGWTLTDSTLVTFSNFSDTTLAFAPLGGSAEANGLGPRRDKTTGRSTKPCRTPRPTVRANCVAKVLNTYEVEKSRTATARNVLSAPLKTDAPISANDSVARSFLSEPPK